MMGWAMGLGFGRFTDHSSRLVSKILVILPILFCPPLWGDGSFLLPSERQSSHLVRDGAIFLLEAVCSSEVLVRGDYLDYSESDLPADFLKALPQGADGGQLFAAFKKEPFRSWYRDRSRQKYHSINTIPDSLADFSKQYDFSNPQQGWSRSEVTWSEVKQAKRRIYRSPSSVGEISIAQTLVQDDTGVESVRETEVIAVRSEKGSLTRNHHADFYVYSSKGALVTTSVFPTASGKKIEAPVPNTCMVCHYDPDARQFVREPLVDPK